MDAILGILARHLPPDSGSAPDDPAVPVVDDTRLSSLIRPSLARQWSLPPVLFHSALRL